jgi:hypothetical protein
MREVPLPLFFSLKDKKRNIQLRSRSQDTGFLRLRQETFPLIASSALLEYSLSSLGKDLLLSALNTLHPITEASTDASEEWVDPEGFFAQKRTHFDTELPEADGDACKTVPYQRPYSV